ncbi:hypothetical protein ACFBZI_06085 [Moraxella sp. ZJ142]|uniref:hypothetical protein n=1 Tax=Moraxella marmotae TaxID=3344520 RepID=UPI0035D450E1
MPNQRAADGSIIQSNLSILVNLGWYLNMKTVNLANAFVQYCRKIHHQRCFVGVYP